MAKKLVIVLPFALIALVTILPLYNQIQEPRSAKLDFSNVSFDVDPLGRSIVFTSAYGGLCRFDRSSAKFESLVCNQGFCSYPKYIPSGTEILFSVSNNIGDGYSISLMRVSDKKVRHLTKSSNTSDIFPTSNGDNKVYFARSNHRRKYAFGGFRWVDWAIFVFDLDSETVLQLSDSEFQRVDSIDFDPTTKKIYFTAEIRNEDAVMAYDVPPLVLYSLSEDKNVILESVANEVRHNAYCSKVNFSKSGGKVYITDRYMDFNYQIESFNSANNESEIILTPKTTKYFSSPVFDPITSNIFFLASEEWTETNQPVFSLWQSEGSSKVPKKIISESDLLWCCEEKQVQGK